MASALPDDRSPAAPVRLDRLRSALCADVSPIHAALSAGLLTGLFLLAASRLDASAGAVRAALTVAFVALTAALATAASRLAVRSALDDLHVAEEQWRSLVGNIEGCVWRLDLSGRFVFISPTVRDLGGFEPEDLIGQPLGVLLDEADAARVRELFAARVAGKMANRVNSYDLVHRRRDGTTFIGEVRSAAVLGADGEVVAVQGITRDVTEQRAAERALAVSEARFARIVDESPMGMHLYELLPDERLVFRAANAAADRLLGVDHSQFVGLTIEEAFPPLALTEVPERYRQAALHGVPWSTEQIAYEDDRIAGAFEAHAFQTQPNFMAVMFLDVTERKRAAVALAESEARFRFLFDEMAQGVVYQDADGKVVLANASASRILGLSVDQMLGRSSLDPRWHTIREDGSELPGTEHPAMIALRTGREVRDRLFGVYNPETHEHRWIVVSAVPQFRPGEDKPHQCFATFTDVTPLREADAALRASETLLREAQEAARLGSYEADLVSGAWATSSTLDAILGVDSTYARRGADWLSLVHDDDLAGIRRYFDEVVRDGGAFDAVYRIVRPSDGEVRWVHQLGEVERDANGRATRLRGTARDITESKQAELAQARLEAQLQRAQRLESLGVLAGGIAHDFNNILAGILGYTELTQPLVEADEEARGNLAEVVRGVHRARDLVRQILAFSRQVDLSPSPTRLDEVVQEVLRMMRAALAANVEIRLDLDPATPPALADPAQLHQVLVNLCTNAAHAMGEGGGLLTIGLAARTVRAESEPALADLTPGDYVVLSVSDTGCGMDASTRDRVFDPFFTTKAPGEGTGLGLATSHGIITSHGGAITVYSEPGQGSTFRVYLPASACGPASSVAGPTDALEPVTMGQGGVVLFVDDEPALVEVAGSMLRSLGYEPRTVVDPRVALDLLRANPQGFAALITDQTMPHMLGLDLARAARALAPDLPIVIASGFSARIDPEQATALGVVEVMSKPYGRRQLGETLARAVGLAGGGE